MKEVKDILDQNLEAIIIPDGIVVISKERKILVFNMAASRITGYKEEEIINQPFEKLFPESIPDKNLISDSFSENRSFSNLNINIADKDGEIINVLASINPIYREDKIISVVFTFRDTREMLSLAKKLENKTYELVNERNKLDAIFNSRIEGTFTIDSNWEITSFNKSAEKITGYTSSESIGQKCWEIFKSTKCRNGCHMERTMEKGKPTIGNELEIYNKQGNKVPIRVNSSVLKDSKYSTHCAVETFIDISEIKNLESHLEDSFQFEGIIGKSKNFKNALNVLESVSLTKSTVLITGESGTGKELAARAIHLNSSEKAAPFIAVNCSAFVETLIESELFGHEMGSFTGAVKTKQGRFELVADGTIFLDEIGDLSIPIQTKLLRVLESREFERVGGNKVFKLKARIIAATNKDLQKEIDAGNFREDLFYRINVINIHLPPLRDRIDDLPLLINYFIKIFNKQFDKKISGLESEAYNVVTSYLWPGNIRELENVIEHCFILCNEKIIKKEHLPKRICDLKRDVGPSKIPTKLKDVGELEKRIILETLEIFNNSRAKTAESMGINVSTLWRKMKKYEII